MSDQSTGRVEEARKILIELGMPRAQQNERSALCLLALLDLAPEAPWQSSTAPLIGITPIMDWIRQNYGKSYAPNSRETIRRQTIHQFVQAGIALHNPDQPDRPVNSPRSVYQIEPSCLAVLQEFDSSEFEKAIREFNDNRETLASKYAMEREMEMVPLSIADEEEVLLSPGIHSELIQAVWHEFGPRFVPGGQLVYAGDTGAKLGYFDEETLGSLGVSIDNHGKMPDVILYYPEKHWLILAEAVTSHGPVDAKRHEELRELFKDCSAGLVFLSAFPDRQTFARYVDAISWETEVWIAESPTHLIHYNGEKFLGPHTDPP